MHAPSNGLQASAEARRLGLARGIQNANHGESELLVYAYGAPPEDEHAEILDSAV